MALKRGSTNVAFSLRFTSEYFLFGLYVLLLAGQFAWALTSLQHSAETLIISP